MTIPKKKGAGRAPAGKPPAAPAGEDDGDPFMREEEDDGDAALPWEEELDLWQQEERIDDSALNLVLYRVPKAGKGKERVWKWVDEIPDEHEIGLQFGSGTYIIYATLTGPGGFRRVKHRRFTLAASYDAERARAQKEQGMNLAGSAGAYPAGLPYPDPFALMGMMMEKFVLPMVQAARGGAGGAPMGGMEHWNQANQVVGQVVAESAKSQLAMAKEVGKMLAQGGGVDPDGEDVEPEEENEFKDFVKSMILEYGPKLLEATGLRAKSAASIIKRDEVFQTLAGNAKLFGRVVELLGKDPELSPDMVQKVLAKLGKLGVAIPLPPGAFQSQPAPGTPAPG